MTVEVGVAIVFVILAVMGIGVYRTWSLIRLVAMHTNSMHEAAVKLTGESERAKGMLMGQQEAVKYITDSDIERAAQLVATRVGDMVIAKLLQNHRFVPKEGENI